MFEQVGRARRGDRRRQGGAVAISGAAVVAGLSALLAVGGRQVPVPDTPVDDRIDVFYDVAPVGGGGGAPAARPAARPAALPAARPAARPASAPPAEPMAPVSATADVAPAPAVAAASGAEASPAVGSVGVGPGAGPGHGPGPGGPGAGPGGGPVLGSGPVTLAKAKIRRAPDFRYPEAADALGLGAVRCELRYLVDVRGRPLSVDILDCPDVFHREIELRALKARFAPARVDGRAVSARYVLGVTFRPSQR
jgi:hypothetical protein